MKVLAVTTLVPFPLDHASRIRAWNLLTRLEATDDVTLLTWRGPRDTDASLEACRKQFSHVIVLKGERGPAGVGERILTRMRATLRMTPPYIERMLAQREQAPALPGFDVAVAEDDAALMLMPETGCPRLVHRHNIFSDTLEGLRRSGALGMARKIKWTIELPTWRRFDRSLSRSADVSIVTTEDARDRLREVVPEATIEVVPNGADEFERAVSVGNGPRAVFVGTLNYEPNVDAVVRFVRDVWPLVRAKVPSASLDVIGRAPLPRLKKIDDPGVRLVGGVDDIFSAVDGATVAVVPLYAGSGIKTKTIEMMAMGLPVVATPLGCEGIPASEGLVCVSDREEMAAAIVGFMKDAAAARAAGSSGRRSIYEAFSWDRSAAIYREVLVRASGGSRT